MMNDKVVYEFEPTIRVLMVTDDKTEYEFPGAFGLWAEDELNSSERLRLFKRGWLNTKQCRQFWQWLGRTDKPPRRLWVYLHRKDLDGVFPKASNGRDP